MRIFINPGHCPGLDSGAVGFNLRECDVVYQIGIELQRQLERAGQVVKLLQSDSLQEICDSSNLFRANLFVSIHANAFNGVANGTETYIYPQSVKGRKYAAAVQSEIVSALKTVDRGVKTANFYVLRYTEAAAILIETAFIDNFSDNRLLKTRPLDFATAIFKGITKSI